MKRLLSTAIAVLLAATAVAGGIFDAREGDLAFVINRQGNAITSVTTSIDSLPIDHVAILHRIGGENGPLYALEAIPRGGVCLTPVDVFLVANGGAGNIVLGRVEGVDAPRSVRAALKFAGRPYDFNYMPDDREIYCSELVQKCYVDVTGSLVFNTIPMTFREASGEIHPYWVKHYADQGLDVPEGAPGTNPGQLSRHPRVTIFYNNPNPRASQHISSPD